MSAGYSLAWFSSSRFFRLRLVNQLIGDFHDICFGLGSAWESDPTVQGSADFRRSFWIDLNISNPETVTSLLGYDCYVEFWGDRFSRHDRSSSGGAF